YILPVTRGNASQQLLDSVNTYIQCRKMITTQVHVYSAGISRLYITATIYAKPLYSANDVLIDVINALDANFGYAVAEINNQIRMSDIIKVIEELIKVDGVDIASMKVEPYVRTINGTTPLDITFTSLPVSKIAFTYKIMWDGGTSKFFLFQNGNFITQINPT